LSGLLVELTEEHLLIEELIVGPFFVVPEGLGEPVGLCSGEPPEGRDALVVSSSDGGSGPLTIVGTCLDDEGDVSGLEAGLDPKVFISNRGPQERD